MADAGENQVVDKQSLVVVDGGNSGDPNNDTSLNYLWTQTGGTSVTLSDTTAVNPTFTAPDNTGTLTFSLVVTDSLGLSSSADSVTISMKNQAPTANAGPDQIANQIVIITLDGSLSNDPDGDTPLTYQCNQKKWNHCDTK